jgi:hypothetical protein
MLKNTANFMLFVLLGAVLFVTSCKKDPFSEKDALQAQKELLAQKFGYDLAIANVSLQIQRAGDSARIAIQNLVNSGATALERERLASALALKLADYNHLLNELRAKDSLSRIQSYVESIGGVRSYQIRVIDFTTKAPINGATVRVLPWGASAFASVRTNSDGIAIMNNVIIDPQAIFYANDENTGVTSATTMVRRVDLSGLTVGTGNPTMEVFRFGTGLTTTVSGTLRARADLTTGAGFNFGAGRTINATTDLTAPNGSVSAPTVRWTFTTLTNATGGYSFTFPRGAYTWSIVPAITSVSAVQKMFVNYVDGVENPFTTLPRVDSMSVTFSTSTTLASSASPLVQGYYFKLPADSVTGANIILRDKTTANFMSTLFNNVSRDIRSADGKSIDTLRTPFFVLASTMAINNDWLIGNFYNYKVRLNDAGARVPDTLAVEVVNLASGNGIISSMPEFVAITNTNGTLNRIATKTVGGIIENGGRFVLTPYVVAYDGSGFSWLTDGILPLFRNTLNRAPQGTRSVITTAASTSITGANIDFGVSTAYPIK